MVTLRKLNIPYPASEAVITAIAKAAAEYDSTFLARYIPEASPVVRLLLAGVTRCGGYNVIVVDGLQLDRGDLVLAAFIKLVRAI
mgnify:FL=1